MLALFLFSDIVLAAPGLAELPAAVAGAREWPERIAMAAPEAHPPEDAQRVEQVHQLLTLLAERRPDIERRSLRDLVEAATSPDQAWAGQAFRAAALGVPLPQRRDDTPWFAALPAPVPEGATLTLVVQGPEDASRALNATAALAGWTTGSGSELAVTVGEPEAARWGERFGYAVSMSASVGGVAVAVDGFAPGPLTAATREEAYRTAAGNLLGNSAVVTGLLADAVPGPDAPSEALERTGESTLCLFRRPDNAGLTIRLTIAEHHEVEVPTAVHGCMSLPRGVVVKGQYESMTLEEDVTYELSDRGTTPGHFRILPADPALVEKLVSKGKVASWDPQVSAADAP